jgi:hypothetical protein
MYISIDYAHGDNEQGGVNRFSKVKFSKVLKIVTFIMMMIVNVLGH